MSTLNAQLYFNAFTDSCASNAPSLNNVKWCRDLINLAVANPTSQALVVPAGQSVTIVSQATAKRFVYLETDQTLALTINSATIAIAPIVTGTSVSPGVYLSSNPTTSLVLTNNGTVAANVFVISAE